MSTQLLDSIVNTATRNPAATAFIQRDRTVTYGEWLGLFCGMARALHARGIRPGDFVGVALGQSLHHCAVLVALARLGAVAVPILPGFRPKMRQAMAEQYGVRAVIFRGADPGLGLPVQVNMAELEIPRGETHLDFLDFQPTEDTPCRISLSSGTTTGRPKGVLHTHGDVFDRVGKTVGDMGPDARMLVGLLQITLSFFFGFGVLSRGGVVIFPRSRELSDLLMAVNLHAATHLVMSPSTVLQAFRLLRPGGVAFPTLRHLRVVGSKLSPKLLDILRNHFSPSVYLPFGLAELGPITLATPEMLASSPDGTGFAAPWARVEVVGEDEKPLPAGTSGRLRIATDRMPTAYYKDDEATAEKFRKGWFYPGDIARLSKKGELFIEGRADDIINIGGNKLMPDMIENAVNAVPGVRESAVFAMDNDLRTSVVAVIIVPEEAGVMPDLLALRKRLGPLAPRKAYLATDLPRNDMGKLLRIELPKLAKGLPATDIGAPA